MNISCAYPSLIFIQSYSLFDPICSNTSVGDLGDNGIAGAAGDLGDDGEKGIKGRTGFTGIVGQFGAVGEEGNPGEKGQMGDIGDSGLKGVKGWTGDSGDIGVGADGSKGLKGIAGSKGQQGAAGVNGADGTTPDCVNSSVRQQYLDSYSAWSSTFADYKNEVTTVCNDVSVGVIDANAQIISGQAVLYTDLLEVQDAISTFYNQSIDNFQQFLSEYQTAENTNLQAYSAIYNTLYSRIYNCIVAPAMGNAGPKGDTGSPG